MFTGAVPEIDGVDAVTVEQGGNVELEINLELVAGGLGHRILHQRTVAAVETIPDDAVRQSEHEAIGRIAEEEGVAWAIADPFAGGADGMVDLAEKVAVAADDGSTFTPLYSPEMSLHDKIETIATKVYGADSVKYDIKARR